MIQLFDVQELSDDGNTLLQLYSLLVAKLHIIRSYDYAIRMLFWKRRAPMLVSFTPLIIGSAWFTTEAGQTPFIRLQQGL